MRFRGWGRAFPKTVVAVCAIGAALTASGVHASPDDRSHVSQQSGGVNVVAGENFYGDLVTQLGAGHVSVTSILSDPSADPHEYESSAADAKAIAAAQLLIENGVGYDAFMDKLMSASPSGSRVVVNVGSLLGKSEGDNPHLWYNVDWMSQLADTITSNLKQIDNSNSSDYDSANAKFKGSLQLLRDTMATIKAQYGGSRVAQTEPVAGYMLTAIGISADNGDFQHSIEEGTDPSPQAVAGIQAQIKNKQVAALIYNSQTVSSVTQDLQNLAKSAGVPVVPVTETLPPGESSYQQWMVDQLNKLAQALAGGPQS
ncbi:MAG TPA: zinc ABC transporter substrate-binding protein [Dehalococcoidia bacterium]|nr:zinc ABC transporter substrate-binding protein [Dehalococcoidia bacterium]